MRLRHECPVSTEKGSESHRQGLNKDEATRLRTSKGARVEILEQDGYISVAAGRFRGYQVMVGSAYCSDYHCQASVCSVVSCQAR